MNNWFVNPNFSWGKFSLHFSSTHARARNKKLWVFSSCLLFIVIQHIGNELFHFVRSRGKTKFHHLSSAMWLSRYLNCLINKQHIKAFHQITEKQINFCLKLVLTILKKKLFPEFIASNSLAFRGSVPWNKIFVNLFIQR